MRTLIQMSNWLRQSVSETANFLDEYLNAGLWGIGEAHWNHTDSWNQRMLIDGVEIAPRNFVNVDFEFKYFVDHGYGIGVCQDRSAFLEALLKSSGIASTNYGWELVYAGELEGHGTVLYYDPASKTWKAPELNASKWATILLIQSLSSSSSSRQSFSPGV